MKAFLMSLVVMTAVTAGAYITLGQFEMSSSDVFTVNEAVRL